MSYIRWGSRLPSGKASNAYVFGDSGGLVNMGGMDKGKSAFIPYTELRQLFKTRTYDEIKAILVERLDLEQEEADYVCERLFDEHKKGEWDEPFEFESAPEHNR